jgi:hypothetical protein
MTSSISPSATNLRDSFDTLSSDGSYDSFYSRDDSYYEDKRDLEEDILRLDAQASLYDQETSTLDEDIKRWEDAAALYEEEDDEHLRWEIFGEGKHESGEERVNRLIAEQELFLLQMTHSDLRYTGNAQNIYLSESPFFERNGQTVQGKELSIEIYKQLRKTTPWVDDYINILVTDGMLYETELEELEKEEEETQPNHVVGLSDKVIKAFQSKRGRKDRKRKFAHKTENKRGKIVEAPKQISKKPYPTWHKKKTGREHKATLVPRDKNEHIKEVFEVCKLKYPKHAPWEMDSTWEEASIELWNGPTVMTTYDCTAQLWL